MALSILVSLSGAARGVAAQEAAKAAPRTISRTLRWRDLLGKSEARLRLGGRWTADDFRAARVTLWSLPSGEPLALDPFGGVSVEGGEEPQLVIRLRGQLPADPFDDRLRVNVELPAADRPLAAVLQQKSAAEVREELDSNLRAARDLREIVRGWVAYAKTTREKHVVISPAVTAPGGAGGALNLHPVLWKGNVLKMNRPINQIEFGLDMDKASASRADPNFLNAGFSFKKIIPLQRKRALDFVHASEAIEQEVERARQGSQLDEGKAREMNERLRVELGRAQTFRQNFFRALVITPFSPRLETDLRALRPGPVNNFVNTTEFQLRTGTRALIVSNLLWSLRLLPVSLESGVTLRNRDLPQQKGQGILRLNSGVEGKVALQFLCRSDIIANRIQFEFKALNRHLFRDERGLDSFTKRSDALVPRKRYSVETEVKYVFGFVTPIPRFERRPALTVRYKNGFFPPSYTFKNGVTFHFTLESDDDDNASDIAVQ